MNSFRSILFPTDFSSRCDRFMEEVAQVATEADAEVTVLHVLPAFPYCWAGIDTTYPVILDEEQVRDAAMEQLDAVCEQFSRTWGVKAKSDLDVGEPGGVIAAYAQQKALDLIMMPTHGTGSFRPFLLGSVTAKVLHDSSRPIWTTAHDNSSNTTRQLRDSEVLCAVTLKENSECLIRYAHEFSKEFGARLTIVHAIPDLSSRFRSLHAVDDLRRSSQEFATKRITEMQTKVGTNLPVCIVEGDTGIALREAAIRHNARLMMIRRTSLHGVLGRLRTHAYEIIQNSSCSILSV